MISIKVLRIGSIVYLMLPNFLFFVGWTIVPLAIFGVSVLCFLLYQEVKQSYFLTDTGLKSNELVAIGLLSIFLTAISGTTGLCFQTMDYWGHNAKVHDLATQAWPLRIPRDGAIVSYYFGYFVFPAFIFKAIGSIYEPILFGWTVLGIFFGSAWIYLALGRMFVLIPLALCFGDFAHMIDSLLRSLSIRLYQFSDFGIENWSNFENLFWVPNQYIVATIIAGMFSYVSEKKINIFCIVLPIALSFWWAVFPALVSAILISAFFIRDLFKRHLTARTFFNLILIPFVICLPVLIFFLSHDETPVSGMIWEYKTDTANLIMEYIVNVGFNVIAAIACYIILRRANSSVLDSFTFWAIIALSLIFPIFRLGKVNDFLFRGMMPLLLIMALILLRPFVDILRVRPRTIDKRLVMIVFFFVFGFSMILGTRRFLRAAENNRIITQGGNTFVPIPYDAYPNVYEVLRAKWSQQEANQYLGSKTSVYEKYLAPKRKM